ncbi:MAG: lysophospholipid acyltransferase family protein [Acidobacteriota bacterium]
MSKDVTVPDPATASAAIAGGAASSGFEWSPPDGDSYSDPMPDLRGDWATQAFVRGSLFLNRKKVRVKSGLEHIQPAKDPFVLVSNHSQRVEAVLLPAILFYHRGGKRVHFMADWPMMLVPGVGLMYRCAQVIPVFTKSAKPPVLNRLKRFYEKPGTVWERAGSLLENGQSVGVFPEGTINRNPKRLLRGRMGAAQLAFDNKIPVVPVGIRFPQHQDADSIPDGAPMDVEIGAPIDPPTASSDEADRKRAARGFQADIMGRISSLSGKAWTPSAPRRKNQWD